MGGNAPITVVYDGTPQAKARARFGRGHAYTPQATVDYQQPGWCAKAAWAAASRSLGRNVTRIIRIKRADLLVESAASRAIAGTNQPTGKPDTDNLLKAALDAINGIVVADDAQVVEISARKVYGVNPKTIVTVAPTQQWSAAYERAHHSISATRAIRCSCRARRASLACDMPIACLAAR